MIGDRIKQARLAAGLTQEEVVRRLGEAGQPITKAALSKYENRKSEPKQALLLLLARVLGVKPSYFLSDPKFQVDWLAFRKQARLPKGKQERIKAYAAEVLEGQFWLFQTLYPDEKPAFPKPYKVRSVLDAEKAADGLREEWGLDDLPIDSVVETLEAKGGFVVVYSEVGVHFDGLSGRVNRTLPVMVLNMETTTDRCRYNAAHELGHLVMDCEGMDEKEEERMAHRFAASFLVPANVARRELGEHRRHLEMRELGVLKRKYGLSMQAWIRRAKDLDIIPESIYTAMCVDFSRNNWRQNEPFSYEGRETPVRLMQMTLRALAEEIVTPERAEQLCKGVTGGMDGFLRQLGAARRSPRELLKLPREQRAEILAACAAEAEEQYRTDPALTAFEAFGESDLYDEGTGTEKR